MSHRLEDLIRLYKELARLQKIIGDVHRLSYCNSNMIWPQRGVYFFMEEGEARTDTGQGLRIVRIGTHALKDGAQSTLWGRLSQHKGQVKSSRGNHRGSIFRLLVGTSLNNEYQYTTWGKGNTAKGDIRKREEPLEHEVSFVIRNMPFLWLAINDDPAPTSMRGYVERNSIALLSNFQKAPLDSSSSNWLGHSCNREKVRESGLWNQNHVDEDYDPAFLDTFSAFVDKMESTA